jgi:hypothetical protein
MQNDLLLVERMVLESIMRAPKNYFELSDDTGLSSFLIKNLTDNFIMRGYIILFQGRFALNRNHTQIKELFSSSDVERLPVAVKELFVGLINHYFEKDHPGVTFRLQKVEMTESEEIMLNNLFMRINCLVGEIKAKKSKRSLPLKNHKVLFWGSGNYRQIVDSTISLAI